MSRTRCKLFDKHDQFAVPSKMSVLFLHLALVCSSVLVVADPQEGFCDSRRFSEGALLTIHDTVLAGHANHTYLTPGIIACSQRCLSYVWCISINYQYNAGSVGECELNSKGVLDPDGKQDDLIPKKNYLFSQLRSSTVRAR